MKAAAIQQVNGIYQEDMDRIERVVNRVFARVSVLEARVSELERELAREQFALADAPIPMDRPRLVDGLRRTA